MTRKEMVEKVKEIKEKYEDEYYYIGVRFEDKERTIGEIIEDYSKSNTDREDEREFPEYGTEEYETLEDLNGISAWNAFGDWGWNPLVIYRNGDAEKDIMHDFLTDHCYILGSQDVEDGEDNNEIVMKDAVVIEKLF